MRFIVSIIMTGPSFLLISFFLSSEYWGRIYGLWGLIFCILCFILTFFSLSPENSNEARSISRLFSIGSLSWVISCVGLAIINFSPLCLGQDNGDGHNNIGNCVLLTIIWPVYNSTFIFPSILFFSWISHHIQVKCKGIKGKV